jgi:formyl-CoA transferase
MAQGENHVVATGAIAWVEHPQVGRISLHRIPGVPQPAPGSKAARSPAIGEHTREVLGEIGLAPAAITALEAAGVVRAAAPAG